MTEKKKEKISDYVEDIVNLCETYEEKNIELEIRTYSTIISFNFTYNYTLLSIVFEVSKYIDKKGFKSINLSHISSIDIIEIKKFFNGKEERLLLQAFEKLYSEYFNFTQPKNEEKKAISALDNFFSKTNKSN